MCGGLRRWQSGGQRGRARWLVGGVAVAAVMGVVVVVVVVFGAGADGVFAAAVVVVVVTVVVIVDVVVAGVVVAELYVHVALEGMSELPPRSTFRMEDAGCRTQDARWSPKEH